MDQNALNLVSSNRDAIATNRGFYFQYLSLLKKWVENFINGSDTVLHSEVGDDIRESGNKLVFTQLKCYSSSFSLNSKEIRKALYIFFLNYLKESPNNPGLGFVFETNTGVSKNEKLLQSWISGFPLAEGELLEKCCRRVGAILLEELNRAQRSKLESAGNKAPERSVLVKAAYQQLKDELNEQQLCAFTAAIRWCFMEKAPEVSIGILVAEILQLLRHKAFQGRPENVLMKVLLSEIYRCSQHAAVHDRALSSQSLRLLLEETDTEFSSRIDERITTLFRSELDSIHQKIESLKTEQLFHAERLEKLDQKVDDHLKIPDLPKDLTVGPVLHVADLARRTKDTFAIDQLLNERRQVAVTGPGGIGKSTLLKLYLHEFYDHYDHVLWLDAEMNLAECLQLHEGLCTALGINITELVGPSALSSILQKLNTIKGNNILIIDNCDNDESLLAQLCGLRNWKILASSRMLLKHLFTQKLSRLNFDQARILFEKIVEGPVQIAELQQFFSLVDYNILLIELAAKTIQSSLDLDLTAFLRYFEAQQLDDLDLEIDIEVQNSNGNVQLFSFLESTFKLSGLTGEEQYLLDFLALLPTEVDINDLIEMAGNNFKKENTPFYLNTITQLEKKGWLEREKNKIRIHRLVQETSIYRQRKEPLPFQSSMFMISWLIRRFEDGYKNNVSTSLRFYKYGLSVLNAIKEPYRQNLYQPLLRLENEVWYVNNLLIADDEGFLKWNDLEERAAAYLNAADPFLGVIRLNFAMALFKQGADQQGIDVSLSAIAVFKRNLPAAVQPLLTAMTNLTIIYSQMYRFDDVLALMKEMMEIRKLYKLSLDPSVVATSNAMGLAHQRAGNLDKASGQFRLAIQMHFRLDKAQRNDAQLLSLINNLAINLFVDEKFEEAITNQRAALKLAETLGIYNTSLFRQTVDTLYSFYVNLERFGEAEALEVKYEGKYF